METLILTTFSDEIVLRLIVAMVLGMIIGTERILAHKTAGMRTYAFVSLGAALFIIISELASAQFFSVYGEAARFDPLRLASEIIAGVGFLGAGVIIFLPKEHQVHGLTTASGIWVSAGIGMAVGFGFYKLAILVTLLALFILTVLWFVEEKVKNLPLFNSADED